MSDFDGAGSPNSGLQIFWASPAGPMTLSELLFFRASVPEEVSLDPSNLLEGSFRDGK